MPHCYRNIASIGLVLFLSAPSQGSAADHRFAGRWYVAGGTSPSVGIVQNGTTVAMFSRAGWSMALLEPETYGVFASGEGKWTFEPDGDPIPARFMLGQRGSRLFLRITSSKTDRPVVLDIILQQTGQAEGCGEQGKTGHVPAGAPVRQW